MKNTDIEDFVNKVNDVKIPEKLDNIIQQAIDKGVRQMRRKRSLSNAMKFAAAVAVVISTFIASVHFVPAFAAQIEKLPGGETIVKFLRFNRASVSGGEITDGKDINKIEKEVGETETPAVDDNSNEKTSPEEKPQSEIIKIAIGSEETDDSLSHYEITYLEYPYSAVVYVSGVRAFSAADDLKNISEGPLVRNAYRLVTLDDSAHRFVITLKKPVSIEVTEETGPPRLVLTIKEEKAAINNTKVYSVRSESMPFGEGVGVIEEILIGQYNSQHARMLQDSEGTYLVEEGYYATEAEAQARIDEINAVDPSLKLYIEERTPEQLPMAIK